MYPLSIDQRDGVGVLYGEMYVQGNESLELGGSAEGGLGDFFHPLSKELRHLEQQLAEQLFFRGDMVVQTGCLHIHSVSDISHRCRLVAFLAKEPGRTIGDFLFFREHVAR